MLLTLVERRPFLRSRTAVPYRVDRDPRLVARWAAPADADRGRTHTPAGPIEYLAVPLRSRGDTQGVFVAVVFRDPAQAELKSAVRATGVVGLAILVLGSLLAWRLAAGVLRPVRALSNTAQAISDSDLTRRIPVIGNDEVAQLATRFNSMLDRLETAFAIQGRLVDDAGHELRTPLTIIRGHLELVGDDPDERRETMALVLDEIDRMTRMVDDLLLLAKAEQADILHLESVDLAALTAELYAKGEALANRAWSIEHTGRGMIIADRHRLTQAMMQLAHNAARHTCDGAQIAIGSSIEDGQARLWIRDSGPGVPPGEHERIFERFARGASGQRLQGAGLGLAIVKAIAEAHNGRVELDSPPGAGATFTLVIPTDELTEAATRY
jgi:signal transduction histidine kinase